MKNSYKIVLLIILIISFVLRFYKLDTNPPGLYIDEAAIGYNAYTILKTGRDEHGDSFPLFFKSFGDYKMPVYIYSTSLSMFIFGKNEFAVRFPSAFFGVLTVLVIYLLLKKILILDKNLSTKVAERLSLLSAFLLGISSWHIHFSRGGFETNQALFLFLLSIFLALLYLDNKKTRYLIITSILFAISIYTYHSYRIISPLFFGIFSSFIFYKYKNNRLKILTSGILFILFCLPIFLFSFSDQGSARFSATSVFSELGNLTFVQKIVEYPFAILKNYLSYFSFYFLFDTGDGIGRHQIPEFGLLFKWQLPFLLIGIYSLLKSKGNILKIVVLSLLFVAPIPASLAVPSPHSLRSLLMLIPLIILISLGMVYFFNNLKKIRVYVFLVILILAIFEFIFYSHYYCVHYPQVNQKDWGAGYKDIVLNTDRIRSEFDYVIVDKNLNFSPIYFNFYSANELPKMVDVSWNKPSEWTGKRVLYIRPYYGSQNSEGIIYNVFLDKKNREDIVAQFWKL